MALHVVLRIYNHCFMRSIVSATKSLWVRWLCSKLANLLLLVTTRSSFTTCILYFFDKKSLKGMLPRRQYEGIVRVKEFAA